MPLLELEQSVTLMRRLYHCPDDKGVTAEEAEAGRAAPPPNPFPPGTYRAYLALAGLPTAPQPTDSP